MAEYGLQDLRCCNYTGHSRSIRETFIKQVLHVRRLQTESGESVGPHRVWLGNVWLPGLAMSRAMGDTMARRCFPSHCMHSCCDCSCQVLPCTLRTAVSAAKGAYTKETGIT